VYLRNSTWDKLFAAGGLLFFTGLTGVIVLEHYPVLRIVLAPFLIAGFLLMFMGNFVLLYDRGMFTQRIIRSSAGFFWMRVFAMILWLGVLPFVCWWAYRYIQHHHP